MFRGSEFERVACAVRAAGIPIISQHEPTGDLDGEIRVSPNVVLQVAEDGLACPVIFDTYEDPRGARWFAMTYRHADIVADLREAMALAEEGKR